MISLTALTTTTAVTDWLRTSTSPRVLHVFDQVCNLVDGKGRVISLVTTKIGKGPFSLVVDLPQGSFTDFITSESRVSIAGFVLKVSSLVVVANSAELWEARPLWESVPPSAIKTCLPLIESKLATSSQNSLAHVNGRSDRLNAGRSDPTSLQAKTAISLLQKGLETGDVAACREGARRLAGLGVGLTPAGDDYLLGVIYGLRLTEAFSRKGAKAQRIVDILAEEAVPRTTTLSAAWLGAASRGEAGQPWHELVSAMRNGGETVSTEPTLIQAIDRILSTGHTSGADALAGFVMTLQTTRLKDQATKRLSD